MSLLQKLKKSSTIEYSDVLSKSMFFSEQDVIPTDIPAMNVALSGQLHGGSTSGFTMFAGPSKHFKTALSLILAKAYLDKYEDAVLLFYDNEFGSPQSYFDSFGIPLDRVLHSPITDIEMLKHDIMTQLEQIKRGDKVMIVIDSIGNLASKKEIKDAIEGKDVADMTRAKALKSLFRMVTPHLSIKNISLVAVNHTYKEIALYPKDIVSGGTGSYYGANTIFIVGRQQETNTDKDLLGYNFILNVEKSRFVREKSKIPIAVTFDGGVSKWSGLLDMALESGNVIKPSQGWYSKVDMETGEIEEKKYRIKDTNTSEFWLPVLNSKQFQEWVENTYRIGQTQMINDDDIGAEYEA